MALQLHPKARKGEIVYKPTKSQRALRKFRNIAISSTVLLILLAGAGFAYTWYFGDHVQTKIAAPATPLKTSIAKPPPQARNVPIGVSIQLLSSPVAPGDNASVSIRTAQQADCTISVIYDKTPSKDSGLKPKQSDIYGFATWSWTVEASAPLGKWPVKVTCVRDKHSAMVVGDLVLEKAKATN